MRIGIDIMGGDFAPEVTIQGAVMARKELPDNMELIQLGDQNVIYNQLECELSNPGSFLLIHTTDQIVMGDNPSRLFTQKPDSGIAKGLRLLKKGTLDGSTSAGNTGTILIGAMLILNPIPGTIRPFIAAAIPNDRSNPTIILDVGLNPECKSDVLYPYGIPGSRYSEIVYNIKDPNVSSLNIGSEEDTGNLLTRVAYQVIKGTNYFNFDN